MCPVRGGPTSAEARGVAAAQAATPGTHHPPRGFAIVFGQAGAGPERPAYADARPPAESLRSVQFSCQLLSRHQGQYLSADFVAALGGVPAEGFHTYGESWLGHVNQTLTGVVFGTPSTA
jgi:hypothetical protein